MRPTEFDLWDDTLVVFIRKPDIISPTGLAMRAMRSPALNFIRREKDGKDCLIHLRSKDGAELIYRITQDDAVMLSAADELGTYRFEFEPERS